MLSEFDFEVVHKPGVDNEMDCLSRFPAESSADCTGVRQEGELEGGCVWSAAACLAWAPTQTGAQLLSPAGVQTGAGGADGPREEDAETAEADAAGSARGRGAASRGLSRQHGVQGPVVLAQGAPDVWADAALLALLQGTGYPVGCGRAERDHLQHRARQYRWQGGRLVRLLADGGTRVIPRVAERGPLVRDVHERAGHFGVRKTLSLLRPHYCWTWTSQSGCRRWLRRGGRCSVGGCPWRWAIWRLPSTATRPGTLRPAVGRGSPGWFSTQLGIMFTCSAKCWIRWTRGQGPASCGCGRWARTRFWSWRGRMRALSGSMWSGARRATAQT
jgi:hypothetical protein